MGAWKNGLRPHFVRSLGDEKNYYFYLQHEEKLVISLREVLFSCSFLKTSRRSPLYLCRFSWLEAQQTQFTLEIATNLNTRPNSSVVQAFLLGNQVLVGTARHQSPLAACAETWPIACGLSSIEGA